MKRQLIIAGGGGQGIDGNSAVLTLGENNLVVDVGLFLHDGVPRSVDLASLKLGNYRVVVTHAHNDHIGGLPFVDSDAQIYGTQATRAIGRLMLKDASSISRARGFVDFTFLPSFIDDMFNERYLGLDLDRTTKIEDGLTLSLWPAGHILGAAMPFINHEGYRILHTGNFSVRPQRLIPSAQFYSKGMELLILDSTYGGRDIESREFARLRLIETLLRVISKGGKIFIPAFSLGRVQEILQILTDFKKIEMIPSTVPIYVDGNLAQDLNAVHLEFFDQLRWPDITDNIFAKAEAKSGERGSLFPEVTPIVSDEHREDVVNSTGSCIIVVGSGHIMSRASRSVLPTISSDPRNAICLTGYVAEDTVADMVLSSGQDDTLSVRTSEGRIEYFERRCLVAQMPFSAHASGPELVQVVRDLEPKMIVLVHGSRRAKTMLKRDIDATYPCKILIPENGERIELTD